MPVEERVVIKIDIDADLAADSAKMTAFFTNMRTQAKLLERDLDKLEKRQAGISKRFDKTEKSGTKLTKRLEKLKRGFKGAMDAAGKFINVFFKFGFIASAIEIGLVGAALLSVKLIMAGSRFTMQAYNVALTAIGVAAGGAAVAIGSVAAAMQQMQEVQLAPWIGGVRNASIALRNTFNDDMLSFFGMEGLQGAVTALGRGGVDASQGYTSILRSLGDYTPDPKELTELAKVYAEIQKSGVVGDSAFSSLNKINPTLTAGIGELMGGLNSEDLAKAASSGGIDAGVFNAVLAGDATATDGFEGQLERISMTVVGQLKGMIPRIFGQFAELGRPFLQTIWEVLRDMESIISMSIARIRTTVTNFGLDAMIPGFLDAFQVFNDILVKLINESLPKVEGWFAKVNSWWQITVGWFRKIGNIFAPLEEGADILWDTLKNILGPFFTGFGSLVTGLNQLLIDNKQAFLDFGTAFGGVFSAIIDWFQGANEQFSESLPIWTDFLDTVADDLVPALGDLLEMFSQATRTILPALASAMGLIASTITAVANSLSLLMKYVPVLGPMMAMLLMPGMLGGGLARKGLAGLVTGKGAVGAAAFTGGTALKAVGGGAVSAGGVAGGSMLAGAGILAGAGLGGWAAGSLAGDNVAGVGGMALGIGGGVATGAAIGAFGGPFGIAAGAIVGGIVGGITTHMKQKDNKDDLEEMASMLAPGDGIIDDAEFAVFTDFNDRVSMIADTLNLTDGEVKKLANTMGVELWDTTESLVQQMKDLGALSDFHFSLGNTQDLSTKSFFDSIFAGEGFKKEFVAPEAANTANAALQEISALKSAGRDIPPDLVRQFIEADAAYRQAEYGNTGSELTNGLLNDAAGIDETYGLDGLITRLAQDAQQGLIDRMDPAKNTDMQALQFAMFDSLEGLGLSEPERQTRTDELFAAERSELERIAVESPQLLDTAINDLIMSFTTEDVIEKQQRLADSLVILGDAMLQYDAVIRGLISKEQGGFIPPGQPTPVPTAEHRRNTPTGGRGRFAPHSGSTAGAAARTSSRTPTAGKTVVNNKVTNAPRANVRINVGLDTAVRQLGAEVDRKIRNALSRGSRYGADGRNY